MLTTFPDEAIPDRYGPPYRLRQRAFDKLVEIAKHYSTEEGSAPPPEMVRWCIGVAAGDVMRPKRPRGQHRSTNQFRDRLIASVVPLIQEDLRENKESAIEMVARAVEQVKKKRKPRASFGPDAVKTVLKKKK